MKKVLVTGAFGQLGTELRLLTEGRSDFVFTDIRSDEQVRRLDICDRKAVDRMIVEENVGVIINCAAYTNVNAAETDTALCQLINATGPGVLARAALRHNAAIIHISTEYVFDGRKSTGYRETDRRHPLSAYGRSKRDGEDAVRNSGCRGLVIRTSWLYSPFGNNFVKTMLNLTATKSALKVVFDQVGTPTLPAISLTSSSTLWKTASGRDVRASIIIRTKASAHGMISR